MSESKSFDTKAEAAPERPVGREQVVAAAIRAASELFAENNPSQVSVREIARRAGVSHALVHRYLGSKEDIFRAVVASEEAAALEFFAAQDDLTTAPEVIGGRGVPIRYLTIMMRAYVEGMDVHLTDSPVMRRLFEMLERYPVPRNPADPAMDIRVCVMTAMAATAAVAVAHEFFSEAVGLSGSTDERFHEQFRELIVHVLSLGTPSS